MVEKPNVGTRKAEDSVDGCRARARADRATAAETVNDHMRATFKRSATAWSTRASLLERLEASSSARTETILEEKKGAAEAKRKGDG